MVEMEGKMVDFYILGMLIEGGVGDVGWKKSDVCFAG